MNRPEKQLKESGDLVQKENEKGLVIVYTGDGKGKTTAALGLCIRAAGYDKRVCIIQFIKGSWKYGELDGIKKLAPNVELYQKGLGFIGIIDDKLDKSEHIKAAGETLGFAKEKMHSGKYDIVILDEINVAIHLNLISVEDVISIIDNKPESLDLVLTGRNAKDEIIERADLVTEMREIKHPFQKGIKAKKGIDF
ncbi:MAG: cob(I)yrinic acid a,c-diamide adenosyltransferase [Candidatus Zixiibacteriota bacterium]|nr:MAG: cob(I)yrinic acid a,c-diamide adenosyltransferase [candidate division Zixibacteria bacterium]